MSVSTLKKYRIECKYKADLYFSDRNKNYRLDSSIEGLSKKHTGAGLGMGYRDHSFHDLSRKEADRIANKARKIKGVTAVVRVQRY